VFSIEVFVKLKMKFFTQSLLFLSFLLKVQ